jgi:hypothetical protein
MCYDQWLLYIVYTYIVRIHITNIVIYVLPLKKPGYASDFMISIYYTQIEKIKKCIQFALKWDPRTADGKPFRKYGSRKYGAGYVGVGDKKKTGWAAAGWLCLTEFFVF